MSHKLTLQLQGQPVWFHSDQQVFISFELSQRVAVDVEKNFFRRESPLHNEGLSRNAIAQLLEFSQEGSQGAHLYYARFLGVVQHGSDFECV